MKSLIVCSLLSVLTALIVLPVIVASTSRAADAAPAAPSAPATQPAANNKKCPVSGEDVSAKSKTVQYKDKTVGFCCDDCVGLFNKNPEKYADKIK